MGYLFFTMILRTEIKKEVRHQSQENRLQSFMMKKNVQHFTESIRYSFVL